VPGAAQQDPIRTRHRQVIDAATVLAYQQSEYRVHGSVPIILQVGVRSAQLAILQQVHRTDCSAFVTACNPLGVLIDDAVNTQRQEALAAEISRLGHIAIGGLGQHPTGQWPAEPSFLVLGLSRAGAQQLGRQFEQNAVLWANADATPQLLLLR
jgi:hypothetical protein